VLAALLDELQARKQLSDERFAEARARALSRKYGAARIRRDLRSKGVAADIVEGVPGGDELERARAILERKYRTPPASFAERAKRARFLQGRGFSLQVIHDLLDVVEPKAYDA
jgi:regulatory protein